MNADTRDWIRKAEGDFITAEHEFSADPPNYDAVAFHSQQCAEKYLKSCLVEAKISFPKTHDLAVILDLVLNLQPAWEDLRPDLNSLTALGIEVRYPGTFADKEEAELSLRIAGRVRDLIRDVFQS
jgi:HEPN domain-containing protein